MTAPSPPPETVALAAAIAAAEGPDGPAAIAAWLRCLMPFTSILAVAAAPGEAPRLLHDDIPAARRSAVVDGFLRGAYLLDPLYARIRPGLGTCLLTLREVQPDHFRKSEYFRGYYADTRLIDEAGLFVELSDGRHVYLSLGRAAGMQGFSPRERARLAAALPVAEALVRRQWGRRPGAAPTVRLTLEAALGRDRFAALTPREREIAGLMLGGHSAKSTAREAGISPGTVNIHRKNIYQKLGVSSQSQLFSLFLDLLL